MILCSFAWEVNIWQSWVVLYFLTFYLFRDRRGIALSTCNGKLTLERASKVFVENIGHCYVKCLQPFWHSAQNHKGAWLSLLLQESLRFTLLLGVSLSLLLYPLSLKETRSEGGIFLVFALFSSGLNSWNLTERQLPNLKYDDTGKGQKRMELFSFPKHFPLGLAGDSLWILSDGELTR